MVLFLQKFTVPQRFFLHFYVVASIWTTFLLVATWIYAYRMAPLVAEPLSYSTLTSFLTGGLTIRHGSDKLREGYVAWQAVFLLLLMEAQVLRRLFETIHVFNYSPSARMHIIGYITGLL
jgi:3-oxo-5-alpha-steroid 4-dehydrogenase 3 / polyprenol reductase